MERFVENPDFLQELFLEEAWKNVDKIDGFIESKANAEEFEVTAEEVNSLYRTMHSIKGSAAMMGYPAISETAFRNSARGGGFIFLPAGGIRAGAEGFAVDFAAFAYGFRLFEAGAAPSGNG